MITYVPIDPVRERGPAGEPRKDGGGGGGAHPACHLPCRLHCRPPD